jgi:hypothetical protein
MAAIVVAATGPNQRLSRLLKVVAWHLVHGSEIDECISADCNRRTKAITNIRVHLQTYNGRIHEARSSSIECSSVELVVFIK